MSAGREFQVDGAATEKAQSATGQFGVYASVLYPKPPNSTNSTISVTYFIVTHRNAR